MILQCNFRTSKTLTIDGHLVNVAPGWQVYSVSTVAGVDLNSYATLLVEDSQGSIKAERPPEDFAVWSVSFWPGFFVAVFFILKVL